MAVTGSRLVHEELGSLCRIAAGGQGTVYEAPSARLRYTTSKLVYKEYIPDVRAGLDVSVLEAMPNYLENLSVRVGMELLSVAAWPCRLVETNGAVTGFVMPAVPEDFYLDIHKARGVSRTLGEFQHLLNPPHFLASRRIPLTDRDRYQLLAEVALALDVFHRHNISVGDLSPKNLLFSLQPHTKVYFIDCDTMRFQGKSITRQAETPDWDIRTANPDEELATPQSDAYKLGLLALRLLASRQQTRNPDTLPRRQPPAIRRLLAGSLSPHPARRPAPTEWVEPLQAAAATASTRPPRLKHPALPAQPATQPTVQPLSPPKAPVQPAVPPLPPPKAPVLPPPSSKAPTHPATGGRPIPVIAVLAFVAAVGFEWWAGRSLGLVFPEGGPLYGWDSALVALLGSLLGLLRYSGADRRRAEAFGLLAAVAGAYWYISNPSLVLEFAPGTDSGGVLSLAVAGYGLSAVCAPVWSMLSFAARTGDSPPSPQQIAILVEQDRTTLRTLAWVTLTCVVPAALGLILLVTSPSHDLSFDRLVFLFRASPWNVLIAMTINGVWLPVLAAGLILLVRGRWSHRPTGSIWALVLLLVAAAAWPVSRSLADANISKAHHLSVTTRLDPSTGNSLALPRDTTAAPTTPNNIPPEELNAGIGAEAACLYTDRGCPVETTGTFGIPRNTLLVIGRDIAPGNWRIATNCRLAWVKERIKDHPDYVPPGEKWSGWKEDFDRVRGYTGYERSSDYRRYGYGIIEGAEQHSISINTNIGEWAIIFDDSCFGDVASSP